jgi:hypothetical protein
VGANSLFRYEVTPGSANELATVALRGRGTATVSFHTNPFGAPVWEFSQMHYDFAPTFEASTLLLVGGGLAATLGQLDRSGPR